jgi:esterase/lipase
MVGSKDVGTPLSAQQKFYDNLSSEHKELYVIKGSGHTFVEKKHLKEVKNILINWIRKL